MDKSHVASSHISESVLLETISAGIPYEIRVAGRFKMDRMVGSGSFGEIYAALDVQTGQDVACKFEQANTKRQQVIEESKLLKQMGGEVGFPKFVYYGQEGPFSVMVIEMLGPSLEDLYNFCGRKLSMKTVLLLADQLLQRIQTLHERGYIHRDLKPENMLMGLEENANTLYLIDFGLAKKWKLNNGQHIPYKDGKNLTGTARYASHFTHNGIEQSRRDDLEGIGYILLYLLMGQLPWQGLATKTKEEKYRKIKEIKINTPIDVLTRGYPREFAEYMHYCKNLQYEADPDYAYLRTLFKDLYLRHGFENDYIFDWTIQRYHAQISQEQFAEELGLRNLRKALSGGSSGSENQLSQDEDRASMDIRYPMSDDLNVVDLGGAKQGRGNNEEQQFQFVEVPSSSRVPGDPNKQVIDLNDNLQVRRQQKQNREALNKMENEDDADILRYNEQLLAQNNQQKESRNLEGGLRQSSQPGAAGDRLQYDQEANQDVMRPTNGNQRERGDKRGRKGSQNCVIF